MKDLMNVYKSEYYKMSKKRGTYIALFFIILPALFYVITTIFNKMFGWLSPTAGFDAFCLVDSYWFPVVAGVFVTGMIGDDYSYEGIKQIVSSGITRTKFILGQWLALFSFLIEVTFGVGIICAGICSILYKFGDVTTTDILLQVVAEILTIGVLVSFTQTVMHLTKSTGTAIAIIVFVFIMSGLVLLFFSDFLHGLDQYWLTNVLSNATSSLNTATDRLYNMIGVLIYQIIFVAASIEIFKRKQI